MSDQSSTPQSSTASASPADTAPVPAAQHLVDVGSGLTLPGWAVRTDTVVVHAGGLPAHARVRVRGKDEWVTAIEAFEAQLGLHATGDEVPWTALELPEGSLTVDGEAHPPGITPPATDPTSMGARVAFWCLVFPRMRGC